MFKYLLIFIFGLPVLGWGQKPNIIYIMADDLGYGELGSYGQKVIKTPHLDRMAAEGLRFTQFYAGSTLCAPTRASLMTGQHTGHGVIRDNYELGGYKDEEERGQMPLPPHTPTLARMLQKAGYKTAIIGKWGLGGPHSTGIPRAQGFDFFYGYLDQKQAHNFYPSHLWRNEAWEKLDQPYFSPHQKHMGDLNDPASYERYKGKTYAGDKFTEEALWFIQAQAQTKQPFFLYLPYTQPHLSLQVPDEALQQYEGVFDEKPYDGGKGYLPHPRPKSAYAAMISVLDGYVGKILNALKIYGLDQNTVVIFTSDNGTTYLDPVPFKELNSTGGLRGYKGSLYEGGIRVPFIVRWAGKVSPNKTTAHIAASWDVLATLAAVAGIQNVSPNDGISFLPTLLGQGKQKKHKHLYWEVHSYQDGIQAVRMDAWKAIRIGGHKNPEASIQLYDLEKDPAEAEDLAAQFPELVETMKRLMTSNHQPASLKEWNFNFPLLAK